MKENSIWFTLCLSIGLSGFAWALLYCLRAHLEHVEREQEFRVSGLSQSQRLSLFARLEDGMPPQRRSSPINPNMEQKK